MAFIIIISIIYLQNVKYRIIDRIKQVRVRVHVIDYNYYNKRLKYVIKKYILG